MYVDKQAEFSDSQVVTASAISTNQYDTTPAGNSVNTNVSRDIGVGEDVYVIFQVDAAATAAGAATMTITLESSANADLSNSVVHLSTKAYAVAEMTANKTLFATKLPADIYRRYIGVRYTVGTGPLTTGSFSAFMTKDVQAFRSFARGYNF